MELEFRTHATVEQQERDGEIVEEEKKQEYLRIKKDMEYNFRSLKMLATAAEEEDSHAQMIKELETKIDSLEKTKANCEGELLRLRQERAKHTEEKKEEIDKLKSQIRENKSKTEKSTNEAQLVDLINTYDKEMFALTNTKADSQKELKRVSDELNNLRRHFSEIEEERKREEAILEADRQRREKWELMERRKGEAATRIKEAYRLYKLKSKKKKKKKNK
ncbi:uncharacterized protein LOC116268180 [Nymphaea colorata]|uniref:uncharacterized protein LOC116268180 n=1 Tax=Nymphaea colorata TaxID=210225 RepID=UPI00129D75F0|nr:uncharacterized protein LOC116268180 [Nymphaea colorata]